MSKRIVLKKREGEPRFAPPQSVRPFRSTEEELQELAKSLAPYVASIVEGDGTGGIQL